MDTDSSSKSFQAPPLPESPFYWFVGATWDDVDQLPRFLEQGIWENGYDDQFTDEVRRIRTGERIAAKASFTRKHNLPFSIAGRSASVMRIKATGTVLENPADGKRVRVAWDPPQDPLPEWYFYTFRVTIAGVSPAEEFGRLLVAFTFLGERQDYAFWLNQPYWADRYRVASVDEALRALQPDGDGQEQAEDTPSEPGYTTADVVSDGCFLPESELAGMLGRLRARKNLVLQGPPGTGKTWLAKRLAAVLVGRPPRAAASRLSVLQFHPSLSYEDFVRGWRPNSNGGLALKDGAFLEAVTAARSEPDLPFVVVIEEINRGNTAQIFGEILTLLEHDKRLPEEAIALAYPDPAIRSERVWLPGNLYVIGTMNIADRSLALVDMALRRRFSFQNLRPMYNVAWRDWCVRHGGLDPALLDSVAARMETLNAEVARSLGEQFRIGHSYFTPGRDQAVADGRAWFSAVADTEIGPLLDEYFFDDPQKAQALRAQLQGGW